MIFRHGIEFLTNWANSKGRKPLILRGARQTGKSTLVQMLTEKMNLNLIEINFETVQLGSLEKKTIDINDVINEIELRLGRKINPQIDLIFFDEIQKSPQALMSLRYFYEKHPEIKIISAGSLLDFLLNDESVSFPVGRVDFYSVGPVSFHEFILATQNQILINSLKKNPEDITEAEHEKFLELWKVYSFVGGMPEAVAAYFKDPTDLFHVRKIQNSLINSYKADILKYSKKSESVRCDKVLNYTCRKMGEKTKYSEIDHDEKSRDLKVAIDLLIKARVVLKCRHTNATTTPLELTADDDVFKLFFLDVGLAHAVTSISIQDLTRNDFAFKGKTTEQMIAQNLNLLHPELDQNLFYWLQDKASNKAEVDFIIHKDQMITPVEVKAGANTKSKSLFIFNQQHKNNLISICLSQNRFKIQKKENGLLYHIPLYLVHRVFELS